MVLNDFLSPYKVYKSCVSRWVKSCCIYFVSKCLNIYRIPMWNYHYKWWGKKTKEIMYLSIYVSTKRIVLSPGPCLNMEHDLGCGRQGGRKDHAGLRWASLSPFPHRTISIFYVDTQIPIASVVCTLFYTLLSLHDIGASDVKIST